MDRFFNDQNLERLRNLASAASEIERKILLDLLAEEEVKFIELHNAQKRLPFKHYGMHACDSGFEVRRWRSVVKSPGEKYLGTSRPLGCDSLPPYRHGRQ